MTSSSPETLSLTPKGSDALAIGLGNEGAVCDAKFDGKDYPATGSTWSPGWTWTIAKHGAAANDVTWKKDGKDMYKSTLTASANGSVLTESGSAAGVNETADGALCGCLTSPGSEHVVWRRGRGRRGAAVGCRGWRRGRR
jgi:hypothetical protein